jgi:hypothetical protein
LVHDDLGCHRYAPGAGREIKAKLSMLHVGKSSASVVHAHRRDEINQPRPKLAD